jgi:TfoX/Sxy family transcriptional regulator of competence genes
MRYTRKITPGGKSSMKMHASYNSEVELVLQSKNSYSARVADKALGTICSLESIVRGFEERAARLEAKVGSPFEKEERYHHLARRQSEIEEQLDLTKNQAPSQVDAAATDEREENSEKQTETKSIQQTRRAAVRV